LPNIYYVYEKEEEMVSTITLMNDNIIIHYNNF